MREKIFLECIRNVFLAGYKQNEKIAREYFLTPIDVEILTYLYFCPEEATATDIEHERKFKKNTISVHVENLVQLGLLERGEEKSDRRKVVLTLTDKAKEIAKAWKRENDLMTERLKAGLTQEEFAVLYRCFGIVNGNALRLMAE